MAPPAGTPMVGANSCGIQEHQSDRGWSRYVFPEIAPLHAPPSSSLSDTIQTEYHTGPSVITNTILSDAFSSLSEPFNRQADPLALPQVPDFTLMPHRPGVDASSMDKDFESYCLEVSDIKEGPKQQSIIDAECPPGKLGHERVLLVSNSTGTREPIEYPAFTEQISASFGIEPGPPEQKLCARNPIPTKGAEIDRASFLFPERSLATRFIIRLDRLFIPAFESNSPLEYRIAASLCSNRPADSSALLDSTGLPNEPLWVTVALYSLAEKRRISGTFGWQIGPNWTTRMCSQATSATGSQHCRTAMFTVPSPSQRVFLVVRLYRVLQGSQAVDAAGDVYAACAKAAETNKSGVIGSISSLTKLTAGEHLPSSLRKNVAALRDKAIASVERLGGSHCPLESFAISAIQIFTRRSGADNTLYFLNDTETGLRLPFFSPKEPQQVIDKLRRESSPSGKRGSNGERVRHGLTPSASDGGHMGYSADWLAYRINACVYDDSLMEMSQFVRFAGSSGPETLQELVSTSVAEETEFADDDSGDDMERAACRPRYLHLGDDAAVLRYCHELTGKKSGKSLGFSLRCNVRLLTYIGPRSLPMDDNPQVLPARLMRPDFAALTGGSVCPPLNWLLGIDQIEQLLDKDEIILDMMPLPSRASLFSQRDANYMGFAGYSECSSSCAPCPELYHAALATEHKAVAPDDLARLVSVTGVDAGQLVGLQLGGDTEAVSLAVCEGERPELIIPSVDIESTGGHPVTAHAQILPDFWLTPPPPGTVRINAKSTQPRPPVHAIEGIQLGAVQDLISVAPLSVNFRNTHFLSKKTRARNISVRVELCVDDSAGQGDWKHVYSDPDAETASGVSALLQKALQAGNDEFAQNISGKPESQPSHGSDRSVCCVFPRDCGQAAIRPRVKSTGTPHDYVSAGGLALAAPLERAGITSVSYHNRTPCFSEAFLMALPLIGGSESPISGRLPPRAHLLFTFYHLSVKDDDDKGAKTGEIWCPIGYSFYPLQDPRHPGQIASARNIQLPVAAFLPPGYLSICGLKTDVKEGECVIPSVPASHIPWLQTEKTKLADGNTLVQAVPIFAFNLELLSSVRTSCPSIAQLLSACDTIVHTNPASLAPGSLGSSSLTARLAEGLPSMDLVSNAHELVSHMNTALQSLLSAMAYAHAASLVPCSSPEPPPPRPDGEQPPTPSSPHTPVVPLNTSLARSLITVLRLINSLPDAGDTDSKRHPLLEYWVTGIFDCLYHGPDLVSRIDADVIRQIHADLREQLHIEKPDSHPIANALINAITSLFQVSESTHRGGLQLCLQAADVMWFLFDVIVRDLRFSLESRPRSNAFPLSLTTALQSMVQTLTQWILCTMMRQNVVKNISNSLLLFLSDLFDIVDHTQVLELVRIWDTQLKTAIGREGTQDVAVWSLRLDGWCILSGRPGFTRLCRAQDVTTLRKEWIDDVQWGAWLAETHGPVATFAQCLRHGLVSKSAEVRIMAANAFLSYLVQVDADARLSRAARSAVFQFYWSEAAFIVSHIEDIIGDIPSVPTRPYCAGEVATEWQHPRNLALRQRVLTILVFLLHGMSPEFVRSWLALEPPRRRVLLCRTLLAVVHDCDLRTLLVQLRQPQQTGTDVKKLIESRFQKIASTRRKNPGGGHLQSNLQSFRQFCTFSGDAAEGSQMRSFALRSQSKRSPVAPGLGVDTVNYEGPSGDEFDPTVIVGVSRSQLDPLLRQEQIAALFSSLVNATVLDTTIMLADTQQKSTPESTLLLFSVITALLLSPQPITAWGYRDLALTASVFLKRSPSIVVHAPLCGNLVSGLLCVMSGTQPEGRSLATALFFSALRANWALCGGEAKRLLDKGSYVPESKEQLTELSRLSTRESTVAQVRVASLVALSYLSSEREVIAANRQQRSTQLSQQPQNYILSIGENDYRVPFADSEVSAQSVNACLARLVDYAQSDNSSETFLSAVWQLVMLMQSAVEDTRALTALMKAAKTRDFTDIVDMLMRQVCLYFSVPCVALRWLETLLRMMLFCSSPLCHNSVICTIDVHFAHFTEAAVIASLAACLLALRLKVRREPAVDGPGDDRPICLGERLIDALSEACPYLRRLLAPGSGDLVTVLQQATALGPAQALHVLVNPVDMAVADSYSASDNDNLMTVLSLLQLASHCWHLEGPQTEYAMTTALQQVALQTRLAACNGRLFDTPIIPRRLHLSTSVDPVTLDEFAAPIDDPSLNPADMKATPGAGWYLANAAACGRIGEMAHEAAVTARSRPNFYLVKTYGKMFFSVVEHVQGSTIACDLHEQTFIYRMPAGVRLDEFRNHLQRQWRARISLTFVDFSDRRKSDAALRAMIPDDVFDRYMKNLKEAIHFSTETVKPELIERTASEPLVVIFLSTVQPLSPTSFFGRFDGEERSLLSLIPGQDPDDSTLETLMTEDPDAGLSGGDDRTKRFYYESQYSLPSGAPGPSPLGAYFTGVRRHVATVPLPYPSLLPRQRVSQVDTIEITPIRSAINTLKQQILKLDRSADELAAGDPIRPSLDMESWVSAHGDTMLAPDSPSSRKPPEAITVSPEYVHFGNPEKSRDTSEIQLLLQGSILVLINSGPVAIARQFLDPDRSNWPPEAAKVPAPSPRDLVELKLVMARFLRVTRRALDAEAAYCPLDQQPYHMEMEAAWLSMRQQLLHLGVPFPLRN